MACIMRVFFSQFVLEREKMNVWECWLISRVAGCARGSMSESRITTARVLSPSPRAVTFFFSLSLSVSFCLALFSLMTTALGEGEKKKKKVSLLCASEVDKKTHRV